VTTTDPILYPLPRGSAESIRQDVTRARADLAETVSELADRLHPARSARASITRTAPRLIPAGAAAATVAIAAGTTSVVGPLRRRLGGTRYGRPAVLAAAAVAGALAGAVLRRRWSPAAPGPAHPEPGESHTAGTNGTPVTGTTTAGAGDPAARGTTEALPTADTGGLAGREGIAVPEPTAADPENRGDAIDLLLAQHRAIDDLFRHVGTSTGHGRHEAFAHLVSVLQRHETAEREIVHPAVAATGGPGARMAEERADEELVADRLLASLISRGVEDSGFPAGLDRLRDMVAEHAEHEERIEFPLLRQQVPAARLRLMANEIRVTQAGTW